MKLKILLIVSALFVLSGCSGQVSEDIEQGNTVGWLVGWFELPVNRKLIINQEPGDKNCGPASVLNALNFSGRAGRDVVQSIEGDTDAERIQFIVEKYGSKPSRAYKSGAHKRVEDGTYESDLLDIYNELRSECGLNALKGAYLDRKRNEDNTKFLKRFHDLLLRSLKKNEPPIIGLTSESAKWDDEENDFLWEELTGHFVTVVGVSDATSDDGSFSIDYIDPNDKHKRQLLAYCDVRDFGAYKGIKEQGEWLEDSPYICAMGGSLNLDTKDETWSSRSAIYIDYAVFKD